MFPKRRFSVLLAGMHSEQRILREQTTELVLHTDLFINKFSGKSRILRISNIIEIPATIAVTGIFCYSIPLNLVSVFVNFYSLRGFVCFKNKGPYSRSGVEFAVLLFVFTDSVFLCDAESLFTENYTLGNAKG